LPEGDTVHRWADRLRDALVGHPVTRVELRRDPRGLAVPAPGTIVTGVEARGKHLLISFADGATIHTHMRVQGVWHVYEAGRPWRRPAFAARVVIEVDDATTAVCFDAPVVELRRDSKTRPTTRGEAALERLGPDLAEPTVDFDAVMARLARLPDDTEIANALLDQRVAAGVGNVFKSEICWAHRINPWTPLGELEADTRLALFTTAHEQLRANVPPGRRVTYRGGLAVYNKARRPCPRCRTPIRRARQGDDNRVTFWCPTCQPRA
jgi:endonuclease-8